MPCAPKSGLGRDYSRDARLFVAGITADDSERAELKELVEEGDLADNLPAAARVVPLDDRLRALTHQAPVMLFMKGTPDAPRCGFSRTATQLLNDEGIQFDSFDILSDDDVRQGLKRGQAGLRFKVSLQGEDMWLRTKDLVEPPSERGEGGADDEVHEVEPEVLKQASEKGASNSEPSPPRTRCRSRLQRTASGGPGRRP